MIDWLHRYICRELGEDYGSMLWRDVQDVIGLYSFYEGKGQNWALPSGLDYKPNKTIVNRTKRLIDKVAGFMFGRSPEITLLPLGDEQRNADRVAELEQHIRDMLTENGWRKRLLKAGRDCFVGKRVALKVTNVDGRLLIRFRPAVEFFHDVTADDAEQLSRVIFGYGRVNTENADKQRIWIQDWRIEGGRCLLSEGIYNGRGVLIGEKKADVDTALDELPVYVILNEAMTSDVLGVSDVEAVRDLQNNYNHRVSDDQDALKFNMFPQRVFVDADEKSMAAVKISPGATIDLQTEPTRIDGQAHLEVLEASFNYDQRFENSAAEILDDMYDLMSCPRLTREELKAMGVSGKAMRALYWDLQCRCEERWAEWDPALEWLVRQIVHQEKVYGLGDWTDCRYAVQIEHLYPITEDEEEERKIDMQEVNTQVRSRRSYIDKWQPGSDPDEAMQQMAKERQMLEESYIQIDGLTE